MSLGLDIAIIIGAVGYAWFLYWFGKAIYMVFGGAIVEEKKYKR